MHSTTNGAPQGEHRGSPSVRQYRELLQLVCDTGTDQRARAIVASRPPEDPGVVAINLYEDGEVHVQWRAPLSEWLKMRPVPIGVAS